MKNNFRNCLSFWENKLFSSKFREPIIYYTIIKIKLSILMNCVSLRLDHLKRLSWSLYLSFNDVDYKQKPTSCCAFERYLIPVWIELLCVCVCVFFFFFLFCFWRGAFCLFQWVLCSQDLQTSFFTKTFIKNGSHDTIHTFKNYFATMFSVFSKIRGIQTHP